MTKTSQNGRNARSEEIFCSRLTLSVSCEVKPMSVWILSNFPNLYLDSVCGEGHLYLSMKVFKSALRRKK